ncbi:MAG: penicillin-binding protein 2 [Clostridiales bacterium]|nr:penicillin-binding protein 2 [Clostridiales bacterium]
MGINKRKTIFDNRYTYVYMLVYLITLILLFTLFNLQIVNGEEYRQSSQKRLLRERTVKAPRGEMYDRNGNLLVTNTMGFELLLYKTKIENEQLNNVLLSIINILEKNNDSYTNTLPIEVDAQGNVKFTFSNDIELAKEIEWKKKQKYDEQLTAYDVLMKLKDKYDIKQEDIKDIRKIAGIRFDISSAGYSAFRPYQIASNISRESLNEIEEQNANFPGINTASIPIRSYVRGTLASHILGYTGKINKEELEKYGETYTQNDQVGKSGLEIVLEKYLKGTDGKRKVEMDSNGRINEEYQSEESVQGSDIVLTIDANLQEVAEKALADNIKKISSGGFSQQYSDANAGACVAIDVNTGEILAMASYPTYDPSLFIGGISTEDWNKLNNDKNTPMYNRAIQAIYAPGSTFKMATAIAALESGVVTPTEIITDLGRYDKGHKPACWYYTSYGLTHGDVNVSEAIKTSCNYYFYEVGYRMTIDTLEKYASYLGLGQKTGIELLGESQGILASRTYGESKGATWYVADTLSAAIGQSYNSFTPLQLARYTAILCNGGYNITPTLIKEVINSDNSSVSKEEINNYLNESFGITRTEKEDLVFEKENVNAVLEGMRNVTDEAGGTAYSIFKDLPITVGGKTGTAQAGAGSNNGVFVGFAPYDKPEIAVAVVVEHGGHGSYTAEVTKAIFAEYFGVHNNSITENNTITTIDGKIE